MFMNEENGLRGGQAYLKAAKANNEKHVFALESDAGGGGRLEEIQTMRSSSPYTFGARVREPLWQTSAYQDASVLNDDCCSPPEHAGRQCGAVCGQTETARSRCEADYSKAATHEQKRPRNASLGNAKITPTMLEPEFNSSATDPGRDGGSVRRLSLCVFAVLVPLLLFFMQHQFFFTNARSAMRVVVPRQVVQSIDQRVNSTMRVVLPNGAMIVLIVLEQDSVGACSMIVLEQDSVGA
jgi:hypothetical protein